jgi:hypothetical protein
MLQVYILNVSSASDLCCIQVFHVTSVLCFRDMFRESWGTARALRKGRSVPGSYGQGTLVLIPARGSRPRGERGGGSRGMSDGHGAGRDGRGQGTRAWRDEADGEGLQRYLGVCRISAGLFGTIRRNPVPSDVRAPVIPLS